MKKGPKNNLIGRVYTKLTVVEYSHVSPRGVHFWSCLCECGKIKIAGTGSLEHGHTKSCGCLRNQPRIANGFLSINSLINQLRAHYKQGAARRKLEFNLTTETFKNLIFKSCYYCGVEPNQTYRPTRYKSDIKYNGIDRKDNKVGYVLENCITCCKQCNCAKSDLSQEQFFNLIFRISARHCGKLTA